LTESINRFDLGIGTFDQVPATGFVFRALLSSKREEIEGKGELNYWSGKKKILFYPHFKSD